MNAPVRKPRVVEEPRCPTCDAVPFAELPAKRVVHAALLRDFEVSDWAEGLVMVAAMNGDVTIASTYLHGWRRSCLEWYADGGLEAIRVYAREWVPEILQLMKNYPPKPKHLERAMKVVLEADSRKRKLSELIVHLDAAARLFEELG